MPTMNTSRRPIKKARSSGEVPMPTLSSPIKKAKQSGEVPMPMMNTSRMSIKKARLCGEVKKARLSREVPMPTMSTSRRPVKKARLSREFKEEIERKRAYARIELREFREEIERKRASIEIDQNKDIMKELEMLSLQSSRRMMEQLGLYIKDDYMQEEEGYDVDQEKNGNGHSNPDSAVEAEVSTKKAIFINQEKSPAAAVEPELTTKKALRVAMLKSRFADTISKAASQMIVLSQSHKPHPQRKLKEMEKSQTEQLKEKATTKAAMKPLSRREQIETERAAARNALQKMETSVVIDENKDITKELEMLSCGSSRRMMEQLGLFLKDDYMDEDYDEEDYDEDLLLEVEEAELIF